MIGLFVIIFLGRTFLSTFFGHALFSSFWGYGLGKAKFDKPQVRRLIICVGRLKLPKASHSSG